MSDIVSYQQTDSDTTNYRLVGCATHYNNTDEKDNVSFDGLDIYYYNDNCLDHQNCHNFIFISTVKELTDSIVSK